MLCSTEWCISYIDNVAVLNSSPRISERDTFKSVICVTKPLAINRFIGRRPILAAGNSDGDYQMLEWTTSGDGARLGLYVHHTDAKREWAYDRESSIGHLEKGLDSMDEKGWLRVDMARDWKVIYPRQDGE